ncbi:MAG: translation initiation factor IF-2 subunit gamma [Candidatus Diapherotrites archaeon]|nr:translation initiation factor IF-2 subunit gamma [Candidatus Diapherotrites archaeon]
MSQAEVNIGLVGHVDHGKTTLVKALTGKWTDTHSEELKRGITIRLGYADVEIKCCCDHATAKEECPICGKKTKAKRKVAFVDAPGHETLMAVMISGSAIMDGAILVIAANEQCPQPQTYEHLTALSVMGIKNLIVVQNKIDLVSREDALENYKQIKGFLKGTIAEGAPVIPVAAHHGINLDSLAEAIEEYIPTPKRDPNKPVLMYVARSFDVNKPGTDVGKIVGGVVGGSIIQGKLSIGDEIEIRPGTSRDDKYSPIKTKVVGLNTCGKTVKDAIPGGLIGVGTELDPSLTKTDRLVGNIAGDPAALPPVRKQLQITVEMMDRAVGMETVEPLKEKEPLVLNVGTATTIGVVTSLKPVTLTLKRPVCAADGSKVAISRRVGNRWRLVGYGEIQ